MCGIFGFVGSVPLPADEIATLTKHAEQRGKDSSGVVVARESAYEVHRDDRRITSLTKSVKLVDATFFAGHSRLVTNGTQHNQPVGRGEAWVLHNGIVVNEAEAWQTAGLQPALTIDTEVIAALADQFLTGGGSVDDLGAHLLSRVRGVAACAVLLPSRGQLVLLSNNGSLYGGKHPAGGFIFASERHPLTLLKCTEVKQIREAVVLNVPSHAAVTVHERSRRTTDLAPSLLMTSREADLLEYETPDLIRCSRCILPETMPFISFDNAGVCNYCHHYTPRNQPRPLDELMALVEPYRRAAGDDCVVPFSGGRDSCFGLHLIVNELGMKPVTYTYDWGMVTDVGRRNISLMSAELGVENIIVAADITKKRSNITKNLTAWLKSPHLGMLSVLTAGDKHFFQHIESVKQQVGVDLNLWGINPLEVTHFKAGFLGVPPDFEEERVYSHGAMKQLRYQSLRLKAMLQSLGYFNSSLYDTLSGEYFRSFTTKSDYFHLFDYYRWDENEINTALDGYGWERARDTSTTWRIGDGTAGFYNYAYYTLAGFTEHDTFRSNQIREGELTREVALQLVHDENQPRYANIKWYLDVLGLDFSRVISTVNNAQRHYSR